MPTEIIKDEEDIIILSTGIFKTPISWAILPFALGFFLLWAAIISTDARLLGVLFTGISSVVRKIVLLLFGGVICLFGVYLFLIDISIIIDKKIQTVVIRRKSIIEAFNSIGKIPFSDIKKIEIIKTIGNYRNFWGINLNTIQGKTTSIYTAKGENDAVVLAKKISKITDKEISHVTIDDTTME
jgi:hypothetical protein